MKTRKVVSVYVSGFLVGIVLVLYPAAGTLFTNPDYHGFSSAQFGSIFIPQIILAIITSLFGSKISEKRGMKTIMILGLIALMVSSLLLASTQWLMGGTADYPTVLLGTAFLGAGFGFTITALNPLAYSLFPGKETSAVTAMHILLGAGTASAALYLNLFIKMGSWYIAPLIVAGVTLGMILFTLPLELTIAKEDTDDSHKKGIPPKVWLFGVAVFLYGACEGTFGNWGAIFLEKSEGLSGSNAALGLSLFWGFVAVGRILFTFYTLKYSPKWLYIFAPFAAAAIFYFLPLAEGKTILLFFMSLGGLGLAILFPLSISTATDQFPTHAAFISGLLVAAIQLGTGFSSYIIGLFEEQLQLSDIIQYSSVYAFALGVLAIFLVRKPKQV